MPFMHWQLETPSVPKSYSKGEVVGQLTTSQEPGKLAPLAFQQLGQLFCCVYPSLIIWECRRDPKGWALQQPVLFGRVKALGFRLMREGEGQMSEGLPMLCSQVAQSIGR